MLLSLLLKPFFWATHLGLGGKSSPAPAPDPAVGQAAQANAELGREALAFNKEQWAELAPWREWELDVSKQAATSALSTMEQQNAIAGEYWSYLKDTFRPIEEKIVADAKAYDTPDRREAEAGRAIAGVSKQFDAARENASRRAMGLGIDPSSGRYADMQGGLDVAQSAVSAGAANQARRDVETIGSAKMMDAASLGRGLPGSQATAAGLGINAANSATGNAIAGGSGTLQSAQLLNQGYGTAIGANNASGNLAQSGYNSQLNAWNQQQQANARQSAGIGSLVGTIAGGAIGWFAGGPVGAVAGAGIGSQALSSKDAKTDKKPLSDDEALGKIDKMPVEKWRYKEGIEDGGAKEHIGPYAEDANAQFGEGLAPGGKAIDVAEEAGLALAGVQALSHKLDRIEAHLGLGSK